MADPGSSTREGDDTEIPREHTDTFAQINAALIDHGCLRKPLDVSELPSAAKKTLADLLHSMLARRQEDAAFREQLTSKLKVSDSSLERTKRFWKEEQEKTADLSRRLETSKARVGSTTQELNESQASLKRTKEELQKSKRDLLNVKQQVHQQKQANERQIERLRTRFSDESIKLLRSKIPEVYMAATKESSISSLRRSDSAPSSLERKQIEELESKRRELVEANGALRRYATESLNLANRAAQYLSRAAGVRPGEAEKASVLRSSSSSANGVSNTAHEATGSTLLYQHDLFPALFPLRSDYSTGPARGQQKQHPAVEAMSRISESIHVTGARLLDVSSMRSLDKEQEAGATLEDDVSSKDVEDDRREDDAQQRMLARALEQVQRLEAALENKDRELATQNRREDREERLRQAAEVEKQRQRYLSLCRELEKQEEVLRQEREAVQREREEVIKTELSLSMHEHDEDDASLPSFAVSDLTNASLPSLKRARDDQKENVPVPATHSKRIRVDPTRTSTPKQDTMRFVTMRKQRARLPE